jgi:anti-sigma B factor antagonist
MNAPDWDVRRPDPLSLRVHHVPPDLVRVEVSGEIDLLTVGQLRAAAEEGLREHRPARLEIDLAGVSFLDSSGVNALITLFRLAEAVSCRLVTTNPQHQVARVLVITGVAEHLGLPTTVAEPAG